ncbi:MAG: type 4a pilus biogenesis protein PilO [Deltaproteobacteria bacterium]|nr:type 4a pilus biogenesis protein PilO [Deltaproteobacteria bacterium]
MSRFEISKIAKYREAILIVMVMAAVAFFFYNYISSKDLTEAKRLDVQIHETMVEINKISAEMQETQRVAERLREAMEKLKEMEERFVITQNKLPSDKQLSSILKDLVGEDAKRDIKIASLRPMPLESKNEYFRLPFQMNMQARFKSFGEYLARIEDMPRIVTVENFRIDAKEESHPLLAIQLFMSTYVLGGQ